MKKFFLVLFLWFFLFSCNNEIDENINSWSNENQNLENNEEVANFKITAGFEHDFEVDGFGINLWLNFTNWHNIFHNWNNVYEVWNKFRNEAKNDLYERKEIFKEFPDLEKNLTDSEEKIDWFEFYTRLEAGTSLEAEEKPWNKMSLKIDWNYNPNFKWNLYNFPFYSFYCPYCQDWWYEEILTAKKYLKKYLFYRKNWK